MMRLLRTIGLVLLLVSNQIGWAEEADKVAASRESAVAWLTLIDNGEIERSWSQASSLFQQAVSAGDWKRAVRGARAPLGDLQTRSHLTATHTTTLPGAPDGEYVVMQFKAGFERKAEAIETVTTMLESDGTWRVSGYFIK